MFGEKLKQLVRRAVRRLKGSSQIYMTVEDVAPPSNETAVDTPIPLHLYQTASSRLVHPLHMKELERVRDLNPALTRLFFDDGSMNQYMSEHWVQHPIFEVFTRSLVPQMRADIFRYCIVFDRGGFYLDVNKSTGVGFAELVEPGKSGLISFERNIATTAPDISEGKALIHPTHVVLQWAFGFVAGHEILRLAINRIVESVPFFAGEVESVPHAVVAFTGPGVFTAAVRSYARDSAMLDVSQAGIDFDGAGVFRVRGSNLSPGPSRHYTELGKQKILD